MEAGKAVASSNKVLAAGTRELFMGHTPVRRWIEDDACGVALENLLARGAGNWLLLIQKSSA
jgi:hypothetical protein